MDFLIHWPPGPVVATVQCQGLTSIHVGETLQMSLMYSINNFGPSIEPWGTPHITFLKIESVSPNETYCNLFSQKSSP